MLPTFPYITNEILYKELAKLPAKNSGFIRPTEYEMKIVDEKFFKIDSKRSVFVSKCFLFGEKKGFMFNLNPEELNAILEAWQAEILSEDQLEDSNATFMSHLKPPKPTNCPFCRTMITKVNYLAYLSFFYGGG